MTDLLYPIGGYAPGYYSGNCVGCETEFTGDKRAIQCEPCALEALEMGAEAYARHMHRDQKYGDLPYIEGHVINVVTVIDDFGWGARYRAAGWLHDVIEDTPASRADVEKRCGKFVEALVWACTGIGDNRKARNQSIYEKIAAMPEAAIVKVADRIANVESSKPGSKHREMYRKEAADFHMKVASKTPADMILRLEAAYVAGLTN